jgi:hypothetical protein
MILSALSFLTTELNDYFNSVLQLLEPKAIMSAHVNPDGSPVTDILNKVSVTLINLEPEMTVRNLTPDRVGAGELRLNPAVKLNLRVLFAANFSEYSESLKFLGLILAFFQGHNLFTPHSSPRFAKGIDRLVVELESTTYQEWSFLWGMLGTKAMPGVVYKVRMITIQDNVVQGSAPLVTGLGVNS